MNITFVCACNNKNIFDKNLGRSKAIKNNQLIVMNGYTNVQKAYNDAIQHVTGDIICFVHQDVYLPDGFEAQLRLSLDKLSDADWGVLGVAGKINGRYIGNILDRGNMWGTHIGLPAEVQTLDELMLIIKRDTFKFDSDMPNYHLFGADLCMQAHERGKKVFAILAFCEHNSINSFILPEEFYLGVSYMAKKWKHRLPIETTCTIIK